MTKKDQKVAKILEKFHQAKRQRQKKDPTWKELDAFDRGEQWELDGSKIPEWIPKPVTNYIHLVKTTKRASMAIENPEALILGQSVDDHEKAQELQDVFNFVWEQMRARSVVRDCLETSKLLGTSIAQIYYDDGNGTVKGGQGGKYEGELGIRQIDPGSFYPDPNAFRIQDCEFIHIVRRRPVSWVEKEFGVSNITPTDQSHQEQGEIYQRRYSSEARDKIVDFHEHYEKIPNDKEIGGFKYQVTFIAGDKIVRDTQPLRPNCYPFAVLYDYPQRQDFWGMGTCEIILDNQKLINKIESIMALIGALLQNPQKIINRNSGVNPEEAAKYGSTPGHVWVSNIEPDRSMKWQEPPQIPSALFSLADQARANIREITGLNEAYMGQNVGSLQTSSGVNSLIERATLRDRDQMYDFEIFIEELSEIIIQFITEYYTETRIARILNATDQEPLFFEFIGSDYKDIAYDIMIDVSAKAPISRLRKQEELDKLLTLQGQMGFDPAILTAQEYMREADFIDGDKIIERMNMEEIQSAEAIMTQILEMINEANEAKIPIEEIQGMTQAMLQAKFEEKQTVGGGSGGMGDTSPNAGQFQMRQGEPGM